MRTGSIMLFIVVCVLGLASWFQRGGEAGSVPFQKESGVMRINKLDEHIGVTEQIAASDMAAIAEAGYKVVMNNRPDGEAPGQPPSAELSAAAEAAGLAYVHYPITAMNYPGPELDRVRALFDDENRPVLAFCRSGTRSTNLWVSSRDSEEKRNAALARARQLGYDVSMAAR